MYIRKRKGRYAALIRRAGAKVINKTFAKKSDAHKFGIDVELQLQRKCYKDTSNASKTTFFLIDSLISFKNTIKHF